MLTEIAEKVPRLASSAGVQHTGTDALTRDVEAGELTLISFDRLHGPNQVLARKTTLVQGVAFGVSEHSTWTPPPSSIV